MAEEKKKRKKKVAEDGGGEEKEHKVSWQEKYATPAEIKQFLSDRIYLRHNVITGRVECRLPATDLFLAADEHGRTRDMDSRDSPCLSEAKENSGWQPVSDRVVNSLWVELSKEKPVRAQDIYRVIESDFVPEYHPFRYYLDHPFDYAGIYAQAYALYQQGFQYWFSREDILRLSEHNRQFETPRLEYELANLYFCQPSGARPGVFMSVARAMQIVSANISQKLSPVYLGRAMGELGFRRVKYNGQRGYIVVPRTADEIQSAQLMMACEAEAVDSGQQGQ